MEGITENMGKKCKRRRSWKATYKQAAMVLLGALTVVLVYLGMALQDNHRLIKKLEDSRVRIILPNGAER